MTPKRSVDETRLYEFWPGFVLVVPARASRTDVAIVSSVLRAVLRTSGPNTELDPPSGWFVLVDPLVGTAVSFA